MEYCREYQRLLFICYLQLTFYEKHRHDLMQLFFGRPRHFEQLLEKRREHLYRLAYSWCHDTELANDLTQETLVKALKKYQQLKKENALNSWLFTILNNCWRDHCRRYKVTVEFDETDLPIEDSSIDENERMSIINQVRKAVSKLPTDQCQIITLIDLEEMTYNEVANILDIPVGTVMSRLSRARRQLKDRLKKLHIDTLLIEKKSSTPNLWRVK